MTRWQRHMTEGYNLFVKERQKGNRSLDWLFELCNTLREMNS